MNDEAPEETYPYCRWCGRYMGFPGVADHAERHRSDCKVVVHRKADPAYGEETITAYTGDVLNG